MNPCAMVNPNPNLLCQPPSSLVTPLSWLLYPHPQLDMSPGVHTPVLPSCGPIRPMYQPYVPIP